MPSNGGGTKLTRTLLAGEAEGVCSGPGRGVIDSAGEIDKSGDSSGIADGVGVGDSWPKTIVPIAIHNAIIHNPQSAVRNSNIIAPVDVRKKIIA